METRVIKGKTHYLHHAALFRGYVSRRLTEPLYEEYDGRFGRGFKELLPNKDSSQYSYVRYWILDESSAEAVA